ncbi:MAG: hypothetical protein ACM65L_15125 [Microcoleus sp.]
MAAAPPTPATNPAPANIAAPNGLDLVAAAGAAGSGVAAGAAAGVATAGVATAGVATAIGAVTVRD